MGALGFDKFRLCVQVKSGATPVDILSLRELRRFIKKLQRVARSFCVMERFLGNCIQRSENIIF